MFGILIWDNIDVGMTALLFLFILFIITSVICVIAGGNLVDGLVKEDKAKVKEALPYFVPAFVVNTALLIGFFAQL